MMAQEPVAPDNENGDPAEAPAWTARKLLRAARVGTLATQAEGQPFAGLVTPATDAAGDVLLLLSDLSEHTRHLRADPRCAVMVAGEAADANPQTSPRLTLLGTAIIDFAAAARARYLAVHPYARFYAGFADFKVWRLRLTGAAFVGGFARAFRLAPDELAPDAAAVASIAAAAPDIMTHCNADHADTMALLAGGTVAAMVGVDCDGADLFAGDRVRRLAWGRPASDADDIRRELILRARLSRSSSQP